MVNLREWSVCDSDWDEGRWDAQSEGRVAKSRVVAIYTYCQKLYNGRWAGSDEQREKLKKQPDKATTIHACSWRVRGIVCLHSQPNVI